MDTAQNLQSSEEVVKGISVALWHSFCSQYALLKDVVRCIALVMFNNGLSKTQLRLLLTSTTLSCAFPQLPLQMSWEMNFQVGQSSHPSRYTAVQTAVLEEGSRARGS